MLPLLSLTITAIAALLSAGFGRQRLLLIQLVLLAVSLSAWAEIPRHPAAALAFAPWFLVAAALLPESRWRTWPLASWLFALALLMLLTRYAPDHVFAGLSGFLSASLPGTKPALGAALVVIASALIALVRWVRRGVLPELVASLVLLACAVGLARLPAPDHGLPALTGAALLALAGVLYGSYRMSFVDALSGLRNRRALDETMERLGGRFVIAMVDIDHFKSFNDNHGHAAGDVVLHEVAATLRRHGGGQAFRYGGEEFCLLFEGAQVDQAEDLLEAARAAVEARAIRIRPTGVAGKPGKPRDVKVTVSIGHAERSEKRSQAREVMTAADKALYKAKAAGRNRVVRAS